MSHEHNGGDLIAVAATVALLVPICVIVIALVVALRLPLLDRTTAHDGHLFSQAVLFRFQSSSSAPQASHGQKHHHWSATGHTRRYKLILAPRESFPPRAPATCHPNSHPEGPISRTRNSLSSWGELPEPLGARLAESASSMKRAE